MNITDPIRYIARINPAAVAAIRADGVDVPFRIFDRLIDGAATVLAEFGIGPGQVVGLTIAGPDEFPGLVVALGLARLGAASADLALPAARMDVCISEPQRATKPDVRTIRNEEIWPRVQQAAASAPPVAAHPDGAAACRIFASSGTTGTPKFVPLSHDAMCRRVLALSLALGGEAAVRLFGIGLGITFGFGSALRTLWAGGTLVLSLPAPEHALAAIRRHAVTSLVTSPIGLRKLLAAVEPGNEPPPSLTTIEFSGSALAEPARAAAEQVLCRRLVTVFGATEIGIAACGPLAALGDPLAAGILAPGVEAQAVGAEERNLPPGHEGVLRFRTPQMVAGYLDDASASAQAFRDGWFYCGDLGSVTPDGVVRVSGRTGDLINAGGTKLSPRVVEDVLMAVPNVTDAAAFAVPDAMGVTQIWAAVATTALITGRALGAVCRERLGDKAPKFFLQMDALPRNANGKLLRDKLVEAAVRYRADRTAQGQSV